MIGKLVKQPTGYKAFVPGPFPGQIVVDMNQSRLSELHYWASHHLAKLDGITQLLPDVDFFIFMYVRKEAAFSSQIEGTQATMSDAIRAEANLTYGLPKDVLQIVHYIEAMNYGLQRLNSLPLSLRLIREIHSILLAEPDDKKNTPGEFRKSQNWIGGASLATAKYTPPPISEMHRNLNDLEKFLYSKDSFTPLIKTGLLHSQFETIHPFLDGNGRTGRLLITFYLNKLGVLEKPVLYLSAFFKKHRSLYFDLIHDYHEKGEVIPWLEFFLEGVIEVSQDAIETSKKINLLREKDELAIQQLGKAAPMGLKILKQLYALPIVDVNKIIEWTGYTRAGANTLTNRLVDIGILEQQNKEQEYARQFVYSKYLSIFSSYEKS
ncbi:Fic family protein [Patescibacteria group bacterium]|nr:Fic family protein [Patescibacteria group bacterium]